MQQKYELWTRLTYFWHKNEKKISLNFIFCIRNPTFSTYMSQFFIVKICFTNEINIISGGGQLLVSESQGSISRVPSVRFFVRSLKLQGPSSRVPESQVPGSHVPGLGIPGPGFQGLWSQVSEFLGLMYQGPRVPGLSVLEFRVSGSWVSGPDFRLCFVKQLWVQIASLSSLFKKDASFPHNLF